MAGEVGRPTDYRVEYNEQAYKLSLLGHTDKEMATFFEVCEATINNWKSSYPEFLASIKRGKEETDMEIAESLRHQALGYFYEEENEMMGENGKPVKFKNKRWSGRDFRATRFWLMNRHPDKWREKTEVKQDVKLSGTILQFNRQPGNNDLNKPDEGKGD